MLQFSFSKVNETFPKKTNRSERTVKKMHLGMYAETLASIHIEVPLFHLGDKDVEDRCLDAICEMDDGSFIFGDGNSFTVLTTFSSLLNAEQHVKQYVTNMLFKLSMITPEFAEVGTINVQYGDAYYGEW